MKFEFNGQEFDTEKRIFVLGYTIIKNSWFAFDGEESHCVTNNTGDAGCVLDWPASYTSVTLTRLSGIKSKAPSRREPLTQASFHSIFRLLSLHRQ